MEEWQVAIIEIRQDLRTALNGESAFKRNLIYALLGVCFGLEVVRRFI